jgi:hypothetical protein
MSDQPQKPQSISDISHLFLTSVRDKQTGAAPRPVRIPPRAHPNNSQPASSDTSSSPTSMHTPSIDLTPEEYAQVAGQADASDHSSVGEGEVRIPPVTAVIAQHLNGRAPERVRDYARHLAANGERVGLLEVEQGEMRIICFERSIEPNSADPRPAQTTEHFDARAITEALNEMSWDVDRWLLVLPNLRSLESRALLKEVNHWALLSTCDHDGVVSSYRTLKGLADLHRPRLTLALMEAASETQAAKVFRKLQGVSLQFLGIELEAEPAVRPTRAVAEHMVLHSRATHDKASLSDGAQWKVVSAFLARAREQDNNASVDEPELKEADLRNEVPEAAQTKMPAPQPVTPSPQFTIRNPQSEIPPLPKLDPTDSNDSIAEILDLPGDGADEHSVLSAILAGAGTELIECPVRAPMCPAARLAVTRDRGLVLLAVAGHGLSQLGEINRAYRWLVENRALISMAMPQLAIDGLRHPRMRLIIDHADRAAAELGPMLETSTVSVQAYRKLRWAGRTGLLLEAA